MAQLSTHPLGAENGNAPARRTVRGGVRLGIALLALMATAGLGACSSDPTTGAVRSEPATSDPGAAAKGGSGGGSGGGGGGASEPEPESDDAPPEVDDIVVPDVGGMWEAGAVEALELAGLTVTAVKTICKPGNEANRVVAVEPAAGATVKKGTGAVVSLNGPSEIPNVVGMAEEAALDVLYRACLSSTVRYEVVDTGTDGTVINQDPVAGPEADAGDVVLVTVASVSGGGPP